MAEERRQRIIRHTASSLQDLASIYLYNLLKYDEAHADRYLAFLSGQIEQLGEPEAPGYRIDGYPDIRFALIKSNYRRATQGYRIFFRSNPTEAEVIRILHTRMDWPEHLAD